MTTLKTALDSKRMPRHVAIIMDGNSRWAKRHGVSRARGHEAGAKSVRAAVEACRELGAIESLTLAAFSTENWRRSKREVGSLFRLLSKYIELEIDNLHREDIRVSIMGRVEELPHGLQADMARCAELTKNNKSMMLNLGINYGSRFELVDACRSIARKVRSGKLGVNEIDAECIGAHLYLPQVRDVDLLIRTSGEMRISNFMTWQIAYGEFVCTRVLWPDFRRRHLHSAIREYQSRGRRFGGRK